MPGDYLLDEVPSNTGDECHRNIEGLSDNRAKKFFKKQENPGFQICDGNEARLLTKADIETGLGDRLKVAGRLRCPKRSAGTLRASAGHHGAGAWAGVRRASSVLVRLRWERVDSMSGCDLGS